MISKTLNEATKTLFYPANATNLELVTLITQAAMSGAYSSETDDVDTLEFPEAGGDVYRELAIPFLPEMDEVRVDQAEFVLHGVGREVEITNYTVTESTGNNVGRVIALNIPAQLRKVEITMPTFSGPQPPNLHLVLRTATKQNGGFSFGPPIFADPPFHLPGNLYGPVLGGMIVNEFPSGRIQLVLPNILGSAWLIQYATGDEATALTAISSSFNIQKITVTAAPLSLSLVVPTPEGNIPLWGFPNSLLPSAGLQPIGFTPIAQNLLAKRLKNASASQVTLPIPLRFHADSGGAVGIVSRTLTARYLVRPLGPETVSLQLRGDWTTLTLRAPGSLRPESGIARLTVNLLGRELNGGSQTPPLTPPSSGLLVNTSQWAACSIPFAPLTSAAPGSILPLASVRVYLHTFEEAEVVVEVRSDVGGVPGPIVTAPLVRVLSAQTMSWVEFELPQPLPVVAGLAPIWVAIRSTRGRIFWYGQNAGSALVSVDRGQSWGTVDPALAPPTAPLVQLFHVVPNPQPPPVIGLYNGTTILANDLLAGVPTNTANPREFPRVEFPLPASVLNLLALTTGNGRVSINLNLLSRAALNLTFEEFMLFYSPYQ